MVTPLGILIKFSVVAGSELKLTLVLLTVTLLVVVDCLAVWLSRVLSAEELSEIQPRGKVVLPRLGMVVAGRAPTSLASFCQKDGVAEKGVGAVLSVINSQPALLLRMALKALLYWSLVTP